MDDEVIARSAWSMCPGASPDDGGEPTPGGNVGRPGPKVGGASDRLQLMRPTACGACAARRVYKTERFSDHAARSHRLPT